MHEPIVVTNRLSKVYAPSTLAVDEVSLRIERAEFFSILEPSGCGKTTLLHLIGGFLDPTSGEILIDGVKMNAVAPEHRPVNTVFQNLALFPHLNVYQNIAFGLKVKAMVASRIEAMVGEIIHTLKLDGLERRKPAALSGGQQQRVALARALVNSPKVLLLDEPLRSIDAVLRRRLLREFAALQDQLGMTFVFVTHDQADALEVSKRIAVMNAGRIEQVGSPEALYQRPITPFVARFFGETNDLSGLCVERRGDLAKIQTGPTTTFWGTSADDTTPGKAVACFVRPQEISMSGVDQSIDTKVFEGRVIRRRFFGDRIRYLIRVEEHLDIESHVVLNNAANQFDIGQRVAVGWAPSSCLCFVDEDREKRKSNILL